MISCYKIMDYKWLIEVQFLLKWVDLPHKKYVCRWKWPWPHNQDRMKDWMNKLNEAKFQGDLTMSKVIWVVEVKSPGRKTLWILNPWIITNSLNLCLSVIGNTPYVLCSLGVYKPETCASPLNLMVVGALVSLLVHSPWKSGVVRCWHTCHELPSQVCPQRVAGLVISHVPENKGSRGLYRH